MSKNTPITVAYGDGIGPEIMEAAIKIITSAKARIDIEEIDAGEKVYLSGNNTGIDPKAWDSLRRTKVFYKAPITTPQGGGYKSLNVTARKTFGMYANVRPCVSYYPFVNTKHPEMNIVMVRENEEDLYSGIEYRQTNDVMQGLKLISRPGCEKIIRYAFEYARQYNRKKVTCFMKDNIMKFTDGLFHKVYDEVSEEYPDIEKEVWIVDIGSAKMATKPEAFDVIVTENLYGDILSDITAQMTEDSANPSGLLLGGIMMLVHIGQPDIAAIVHNAWLKTLEDGLHTYDIYKPEISKKKVGTKEFAQAVADRLGEKPKTLKPVEYKSVSTMKFNYKFPTLPKPKKEMVGVDVFLDWNEGTPNDLGDKISKVKSEGLKLTLISNRGLEVWPGGHPETFCVDHWRCRYEAEGTAVKTSQVIALLNKLNDAGFNFIKTENLYTFDGQKGYSTTQG